MFVSTFYATKGALGTQFTMPSLDDFVVNLTWERDKLIQMGTLKSSNSHALGANQGTKEPKGQSSNNNSKKMKQKNSKEKKDQIPVASKETIDTPSSKGDSLRKKRSNVPIVKAPVTMNINV